jgi:hypothetical protein
VADRETSATREQPLEAAKAVARAEREKGEQGVGTPKRFLMDRNCTQKCTQIGFFGDFQREKSERMKCKKFLCCSDFLLVPVERIELPTFGLQNRGFRCAGRSGTTSKDLIF